jgi:hypothetical protein
MLNAKVEAKKKRAYDELAAVAEKMGMSVEELQQLQQMAKGLPQK